MAFRLGAEPEPVRAVREQQLALLHREHRHRSVEAFEDGREALVRGGELVADPLGFGDVRHRRHPAGLLALRVDQRRHVHARVEDRAVLSHHLDLDPAGRALALQLLLEQTRVLVAAVVRPVREGRMLADQVAFREPRHRAERRVDVADAALHVHRPHPGQHGVLHRPPEVRLGDERGLHLQAPAHVAPGAEQHPDGERREQHHHPEQAVADQADRGPVALAAQDQPVVGRRHRQLEDDRRALLVRARQHHHRAGERALLGIEHRDRMAACDLARDEVAQQPLERILGDQRAVELAVVDERDLRLEHRRSEAVGERIRVDRDARLAGALEGFLRRRARVLDRQRRGRLDAADPGLGRERRPRVAGDGLARVVQPDHVADLGMVARERRRLLQELVVVERARDQLARDPRQLLVVLDQAEANLLLGDLGVAPHRLLLALELFVAQVPERRDDRRQEEQHRSERAERRVAVLVRRRLAPPPAAEDALGPGAGGARRRRCRAGTLHGGDYLVSAAGGISACLSRTLRRRWRQRSRSSSVRATTLVAPRRSARTRCSSARLALLSSTVRGPAP